MAFETLIAGIGAGLVGAIYGGYGYLTGRLTRKVSGDPDYGKLVGTASVGFIVGAGFYLVGLPLEEATILGFLATIGAVELGQKILKPIGNWLMGFF
jgi:hypothetical protein